MNFGSEDHADWMRRASRMLGEDRRAGRGVGRRKAHWSWAADGREWHLVAAKASQPKRRDAKIDGN
jgi:hypothetical protein